MKKFYLIYLFTFAIVFWSCSKDSDITLEPANISLNFSHTWNGQEVTSSAIDTSRFINENADDIRITRLRYLISDIVLTHESGVDAMLTGYHLIDIMDDESLSYSTADEIIPGEYTMSIRFGFNDADNQDGIYNDLNTASFDVPAQLGGGYHYMQLDGTYKNSNNDDDPFNYHVIRAFDMTGTNEPQDTSIKISLGSVTVGVNTQVNIQMDLYEWFSNPHLWDLSELNTMLMSNYDAQIKMSQNGASAFSLISITQE